MNKQYNESKKKKSTKSEWTDSHIHMISNLGVMTIKIQRSFKIKERLPQIISLYDNIVWSFIDECS